jgi:hypothetical protein
MPSLYISVNIDPILGLRDGGLNSPEQRQCSEVIDMINLNHSGSTFWQSVFWILSA